MVLLQSYPTPTDDDGSGQSGTVADAAWAALLKSSIEDQVHSATNTTVKPKTITDEVVTARGNEASLNARLSGVIDADGDFIPPSTLVLLTTAREIQVPGNLSVNPDLLLWPAGDAAAPYAFVLEGAGATIARTGTGLGDTTHLGAGKWSSLLTFGSAEARLRQTLLDTAAFTYVNGSVGSLKGRKIAVACLCKCSNASRASIVVDDGATQTFGGASGNSTYHSGNGQVEWMYVIHTISGSATKLEFYSEVRTGGAAYFGAFVPLFSAVAPAYFLPTPMQKGFFYYPIPGNVAVGTEKIEIIPGMAGIITDVQLRAKTAPTGAALIVDVNTWDGAAQTTAFTTKPQLAIAAKNGGAAPDGTYARRCITPYFGSGTVPAGGIITVDVDQIGSTLPGADLGVHIRTRQYIRALESLLEYDD